MEKQTVNLCKKCWRPYKKWNKRMMCISCRNGHHRCEFGTCERKTTPDEKFCWQHGGTNNHSKSKTVSLPECMDGSVWTGDKTDYGSPMLKSDKIESCSICGTRLPDDVFVIRLRWIESGEGEIPMSQFAHVKCDSDERDEDLKVDL